MKENKQFEQLETGSIARLIAKFALPAIAASLVGSLYNIVDQIFIGQSVGTLGNAATNVAFPLTMLMCTLAMVFGVGGASNFSLMMGGGETEQAKKVAGNSLVLMVTSGVALCVATLIFLHPLMYLFGARGETLQYAMDYSGVTALGVPFYIISTGASQLIRADGSPKRAMICSMFGALLNCVLDPIFIFGFGMGMKGAALATILGQFVSAILALYYLAHLKIIRLTPDCFIPQGMAVKKICALGLPAGLTQLAVTGVQIVSNNVLGHYGELSAYGRDIPIAIVGIVTKVNTIFNSVIHGIAQSCQPIFGYNYGAGNFKRVRDTFSTAAKITMVISCVAFLLFQIFPYQLIGIFGDGTELYYQFGIQYFRIFLLLTFINGLQILASNFFPSIGKVGLGIVTSLSRQVLFLLPLLVLLPMVFGISGVLYAGPIADGAAILLALILMWREMNTLKSSAERIAKESPLFDQEVVEK